jgi:hypothetical protein
MFVLWLFVGFVGIVVLGALSLICPPAAIVLFCVVFYTLVLLHDGPPKR